MELNSMRSIYYEVETLFHIQPLRGWYTHRIIPRICMRGYSSWIPPGSAINQAATDLTVDSRTISFPGSTISLADIFFLVIC